MNRLIFFIKIWIAYVLDLIFGDPQNVVHPVQVIGKIISAGEKVLLRKKYKFLAGAVLNIFTVSITYTLMYLISKSVKISVFFMIIEIYFMYTIFSINFNDYMLE